MYIANVWRKNTQDSTVAFKFFSQSSHFINFKVLCFPFNWKAEAAVISSYLHACFNSLLWWQSLLEENGGVEV